MRRLLALPLAALAISMACSAAAAGTPPRITQARAPFPQRAFILGLPAAMRLSPGQVRVLENGKPVSGVHVEAAGGSAEQFGVVLLIDASNSMRGEAIDGAMEAARAFASKRTPLEQLAVVAFNDKPQVVLPFTADPEAIDSALQETPHLAYGTHIYDGVETSLRLIAHAKIRAASIVVLSDGADTGSHATEAVAAAAANREHVRVFTVGLRSAGFDPATLQQLAGDAGGQYSLATSPAQLREIYSALGAKFAREYVVTYHSSVGPGRRVGVAVQVHGLPSVASSGYVTPSVAASAPPAGYQESPLKKLWASSLTMILIAFIEASLVALMVMVLMGGRRRGTLRKRMAQFVSIPGDAEEERPSAMLSERVEDGTEKILGRTQWWGRFLDELELAGITWSPRRLVLFTFIGTFLSIWFLSLLFSSKLIALLGLSVPFAVRSYVRHRVARKRGLFAEQLPDNLQVLASAMRAGHSFIGALSVVVDDAPEPSRSEFRRVIADEQLGVPLEDALHVVVERMESRELEQVALVAAVQRNSGGNTAEVLDRVTETIRERFELRRMVKTLTAQGRLSRWIVSLLPVFLLTVITLINPDYMHVLFASGGGRLALGFAALMVIAGSFVIKRIVNIKV